MPKAVCGTRTQLVVYHNSLHLNELGDCTDLKKKSHIYLRRYLKRLSQQGKQNDAKVVKEKKTYTEREKFSKSKSKHLP